MTVTINNTVWTYLLPLCMGGREEGREGGRGDGEKLGENWREGSREIGRERREK